MPQSASPNVIFSSPAQVLKNLFLIVLGSIISACAINGIRTPIRFVGDIKGLSIRLHSLISGLRVEWMYFFVKSPLFIFAWMAVGRRFFFYSIMYTVITFPELGDLKSVIRSIDPDAFVVISETLEGMNYFIGNQPHR